MEQYELKPNATSHIIEVLRARHKLLRDMRNFFNSHDYLEVETPNLVRTSPPDPHIDPLEVFIGDRGPFYLHTSPEMHMKKLLQHGVERIFQICKVYRVEEFEEIHNVEFTMLEWYRKGTYEDAMEETEELVRNCFSDSHSALYEEFTVFDLEELVYSATGINPFGLDRDAFYHSLRQKNFPGIDEGDDWNSLFFKLFIREVERTLPPDKPYFIKNWPSSISTMAKMKDKNKVERFELYINGLEIANGYTELLDSAEQMKRFINDNKERERLGKKAFEIDGKFIRALLPLKGSYTGVSLGIDRLLMILLGKKAIGEVLIDRVKA